MSVGASVTILVLLISAAADILPTQSETSLKFQCRVIEHRETW